MTMLQKIIKKHLNVTALGIIFLFLSACSSIPNIIPQIPLPRIDYHSLPTGQDIAQANAFLAAGKKRDAASAYFAAANNYRSPERERLILQAAELATTLKDSALTQRYLAPINFASLNKENQARFRFTQSQLALNDKNYRETLRILPQRINGLPIELGKKILNARMQAAQASRDKFALVQELVLQEPNLTQAHEIKLNHDRIWNHAQDIPSFKLDSGRKNIHHPVLKNWLDLAFINRNSRHNKQTLKNDLQNWLNRNANHPGKIKAEQLLNATPTTTVTPYDDGSKSSKTTTATKRHSKKQLAVLLPLSGNLSQIGKTLLQGIKDAHKAQPNKSELVIYNTSSDSINTVYQKALNNGADFIIGPFNKSNITRIASSNLQVPTLALNYAPNQNKGSNFYQFGLSPTDEAVQMAQFALDQGQNRLAILTPNSSWGNRIQTAARTAVIARGGKITHVESYPNNSNNHSALAQTLASKSTEIDAILMAASPSNARILYPALRKEFPKTPIYASSHAFSGVINSRNDKNLEGLVFTETPWVLNAIQNNNTATTDFPRIYAMGMDAYVISFNLDKLKSFGKVLAGKTGGIHLSQDGSLHRSLRWARFSNGKPIPHGG